MEPGIPKQLLMIQIIYHSTFTILQLMELVSKNTFGQVLVTDTDETRVSAIFETIRVKPNMIIFNSELV